MPMLGAITGDIIGSVYEWDRIKTTDFPLFSPDCFFTDDSVLTVAVAEAILTDGDYVAAFKRWGRRYPDRGYGARFGSWLMSDDTQPYNSWGNGSAMRVSPVIFGFDTEPDVLREAKRSAEVTHNHPEGIKGAQAAALAGFRSRQRVNVNDIRAEIVERFDYDLSRTIDAIRPDYEFNESCQETVPEAIACFLEADDYERTLRLAISLGGDADTLAAIAGGIAEARWGVPDDIATTARSHLPHDMLDILTQFSDRFDGATERS